MINVWWSDLSAWWQTVSPEFAFLLALPFAISAIALLVDHVRRRCASRHGRS